MPFDPRPAYRADPVREREDREVDGLVVGEAVAAAMKDLGCVVHDPPAAFTGKRPMQRLATASRRRGTTGAR
jgi:hypothetical protein